MAWPTPGCERLIDAMIIEAGGETDFLRAVQRRVPTVGNSAQARVVAADTIAQTLWDFFLATPDSDTEFVRFLGAHWAPLFAAHWAPPFAAHDPTGLTAHWTQQVLAALGKGDTDARQV